MDITSIAGIVVAIGSILGGQMLEGGHPGSIGQPTAAIIVLGGTIGAVCLQFPGHMLKLTLSELKHVFLPAQQDIDGGIRTIVALANKARRDGLVAVESETTKITEPFMKRAFEMAVDGTEARALRTALELELSRAEEEGE